MGDVLISETPKHVLILDGKEYELPSFDLELWVAIEKEFDVSVSQIGKEIQNRQATTLLRLLTILLKKYPEMTPAKIGKCVTTKNLTEISNTIGQILGG